MEIEKYIDAVKNRTLYESREPDSLARDILKEWDTNKRLTAPMARRILSGNKVESTFQGIYAEKLKGTLADVVTTFRSVDGWSVTKAIEAEGQKASKEAEERKGILAKVGL